MRREKLFSLAAVLAATMVAGCGLLPSIGRDDAGADGPAEPAASPAEPDPPTIGRNAVLRPAFDTTEGRIAAGTAFIVRWSDGRLLMLTAHHLLGESGGMSREYTGAELTDVVTGVTATSVDDESVVVTSKAMVDIPDAVSSTTDIRRDLTAFEVTAAPGVTVLELAADPPEPGDRVYLLAEDGESNPERLFPAVEQDEDTVPYLQFEYDDPIELRATSGAPVLNALGQVVGVNIGGNDDRTPVRGHANSIETFRPTLEASL